MRARLAETERLRPETRPTTASFWDARARRYARDMLDTGRRDPLLPRVVKAAGRRGRVLDVGCGPGRFVLPLAERVASVTAVDPSQAMLGILRREARRRGLSNIGYVHARWQDAKVEPVEVSLCSYVLPLIEDAAPFLRRMDAATTRRAFVSFNAASFDLVFDTFWRHFHGAPRRPGPTYLDLVAVLRELGLDPSVEVGRGPRTWRFPDLAAAVRTYRDQLFLPDTPAVRKELRGLLGDWLVAAPEGLVPPTGGLPTAIVSWVPAAAR